METKRAIIFSGPEGDGSTLVPSLNLQESDFIVCADSGYSICASAGLKPDAVAGDFDSLSTEQIAEIDKLGVPRIIYPREKDDTDTMLCAKYGLALGITNFVITPGIGRDFGHTMANLQTLSYLTDMGCYAEIITASARIFMVDGNTKTLVPAVSGGRFSVLSYGERSAGVYIKNAKYPLEDATLTHSAPLGVSNEFVNGEAVQISVREGRLLVIINA